MQQMVEPLQVLLDLNARMQAKQERYFELVDLPQETLTLSDTRCISRYRTLRETKRCWSDIAKSKRDTFHPWTPCAERDRLERTISDIMGKRNEYAGITDEQQEQFLFTCTKLMHVAAIGDDGVQIMD
jgi:hypothetical protein